VGRPGAEVVGELTPSIRRPIAHARERNEEHDPYTANYLDEGKTLALAFVLAAALAAAAAGLAHADPTTFTVNSTNDPGADGVCDAAECTLREAIIEANANPGADTIGFDIPGAGVQTITPATALPAITEAVTINGYSQPGASANTLAAGSDAALKIELSGASAGTANGISLTGPDSVVKGLIINRWTTGVLVDSVGASGNRVEGNHIGTGASGNENLGNASDGVLIFLAPNNVVGGTAPAARNTISGNGDNGIEVSENGATGNRILRNSISGNGRLGIDLAGGIANASRVSANDAGDPDAGPNNLQNFPVITSATTFGGQTTIQGTLNSTPGDSSNLQFFSSLTADPSGFGEGETYAGQTNVLTNSPNGNAVFSFATATPVAGGRFVTATATNANTGDTSEFSEAAVVESSTPPPPSGCTIIGTEGDDTLLGTPGDDVICTLGGRDEADGGGGNDIVRGGTGIDDLSGGLGSDGLYGESGSDTLDALDGVRRNDLADGGSGVDTCSADKKDRRVGC